MDKLDMQTRNIADENYAALVKLFPNALTEKIVGYDEEGRAIVERAIDVDVLRQEISCSVVEGREERYQFTWPDKKKAMLLANAPISLTLRPCKEESVNFDNTENLYIEGDNLDVLKLLQETYLGKIKMIYIDPPYNTGHDFVYNDDFSETISDYVENSGQIDFDGNRMVQNTESNGRFHTDWLNMMYPRLRLAKNLLSNDGVIFISIDDVECSNLKKMCDEIFGESLFVSDIAWHRTYSMRNDAKGVGAEVEHILIYSRNEGWEPERLERTQEMDDKFKNPDNDPKGRWRNIVASAPDAIAHQGMVYAIQNPVTGEYAYPPNNRHWALGQEQMLKAMNIWADYELRDIEDYEERALVCGINPNEVKRGVLSIVLKDDLEVARAKAKTLYESTLPEFYFSQNGKGVLSRKAYLENVSGRPVTNYWSFEEVGHTGEASRALKKLFEGKIVFDTPKPVRLIDRIISIASDKDSIILDFFSGSATTAEAIMQKNAEDGGTRKYILVQLDEGSKLPEYSTLCDVGKERIRRAANKIKEEKKDAVFDEGFRDLKVDTSNMKDVYYNPSQVGQQSLFDMTDNIKEDRTPEDLLFQVMLDLGVLLSSKIEEKIIAGKKVFNVADGFLIACFDADVTEETVKAVAQEKPYYAVFRDSSMANDSVATNFEQIFATYSPETVRKVL